MLLEAVLSIRSRLGARRVRLSDYLDAHVEETAARESNVWIKSLRLARVDGVSFRERFTYRGDSLWWFAELYLHKERAVLSVFRTVHAVTALLDREMPAVVRFEAGGRVPQLVIPQLARARGIQYEGPPQPRTSRVRGMAMDARSTALMIAAVASPARPNRQQPSRETTLLAIVHRAFWRGTSDDGGAEAYIGPVLQLLERRLPSKAVQYVGVGPTANFRARRWWKPAPAAPANVLPIEQLTPRSRLAGSVGLWAARHAMRRALQASTDLRGAATIGGCDCWSVIAESLAGVALLQFPWSARAMDEAGSAFDACRPSVALTYAEAGGWGRALALEARRRGVPLVGLQHGFIYRHWLNYLHEPDEMRPLPPGSLDCGFPLPEATLVFDDYAARHLIEAGRFPPHAVVVTGSPRLDRMAEQWRNLDEAAVRAVRAASGADEARALVLLVTKYSEVRAILPALLEAMRGVPEAQLAIKTHPAETPDPYQRAAAGIANVRVLPASTELAPLLRASRALVTVNSTVALDGLALGVPAMTIGLPNNLSPFVSAGVIAGAATAADIPMTLRQLLYDEEFRLRLSAASASLPVQFRMTPDSRAAERQADIVLGLARR